MKKKALIIFSAVIVLNLFFSLGKVNNHKYYAVEEEPKVLSIEYKA